MNELEKFERSLTESKTSFRTREAYLSDVRLYLQSDFSATREGILCYLDSLKSGGSSDSTVRRTLSSLRRYFRFLVSERSRTDDPTHGIRLSVAPKQNAQLLSREEVDALLSRPEKDTPKEVRDRALLELLYATGITVSELFSLDLSDVDFRFAEIAIRGRHARRLPLYPQASRKLSDYIEKARELLTSEDEKALFVNLAGDRLTRQGVWKIFREYAEPCGFSFSAAPETLRRSLAAHMIRNGITPEEFRHFFGYESLAAAKAVILSLSNEPHEDVLSYHPYARNR